MPEVQREAMSDDLNALLKCLRGQRIPVTADQLRLAATTIETQIGTIQQLRGNLRLAEEGLANYAQEIKQLRDELTAARLEADHLRTLLRRWQYDVGGAMEWLELETLAAINANSG